MDTDLDTIVKLFVTLRKLKLNTKLPSNSLVEIFEFRRSLKDYLKRNIWDADQG